MNEIITFFTQSYYRHNTHPICIENKIKRKENEKKSYTTMLTVILLVESSQKLKVQIDIMLGRSKKNPLSILIQIIVEK